MQEKGVTLIRWQSKSRPQSVVETHWGHNFKKLMTENKILMQQAREALDGKWSLAVGFWFIYTLITIVAGEVDGFGPVLQALLSGPLLLGVSVFSLAVARGHEAKLSQLFEGFQDFLRTLIAYLLMGLYIFLWMLLLIVPGFIAALSYSQTFFILAENRSVSASDALRKSKAMMMGHKKKLFYLVCRFIGWFLLSIATLGLGFLWSFPYFYVTLAKFYDEISSKVPAGSPTLA